MYLQSIRAGVDQQKTPISQLPPLLSATVQTEDCPQTAALASSAGSFLLHASSVSPFSRSELESSSPSHPMFTQTSMQKFDVSKGQSPGGSITGVLGNVTLPRAEGIRLQSHGGAGGGAWQQDSGDRAGGRVEASNSPEASTENSSSEPCSDSDAAKRMPVVSSWMRQPASTSGRLLQRLDSACEALEANPFAMAMSVSSQMPTHKLTDSPPLLVDPLTWQLPSSRSTEQLSGSNECPVLSALDSTDVAFLAASKSFQELPEVKPMQHVSSKTAAASVDQIGLDHISRGNGQDLLADADDDDDDLVLHESKSEAAYVWSHQTAGKDVPLEITCDHESIAKPDPAQMATAVHRQPSRTRGLQCQVKQQHNHAASVLAACNSLDSLYDDNDWE